MPFLSCLPREKRYFWPDFSRELQLLSFKACQWKHTIFLKKKSNEFEGKTRINSQNPSKSRHQSLRMVKQKGKPEFSLLNWQGQCTKGQTKPASRSSSTQPQAVENNQSISQNIMQFCIVSSIISFFNRYFQLFNTSIKSLWCGMGCTSRSIFRLSGFRLAMSSPLSILVGGTCSR